MDISSVCILGGSGFVGSAVAERFAERGLEEKCVRVRVVTRSLPRARALTVLPTVELVAADVHDPAQLRRAFDGMDAVVNLVGILHERRRQTFEACHVELPAKVAAACRASGVRHLLHMSALGASESGPSRYLRSKAAGERAVRESAGPCEWTIFRPSVVFGEHDRFLNLFAALVRASPVIPLAGADARFQPIWVEDLARCFCDAAGEPRALGQAFDLGGPRAYTLEELVRFVCSTLGVRRAIWRLPPPLARLQAFAFEHLPGKLITRDNLASMSVDNVCAGGFPEIFGFQPAPMEAVVPAYLGGGIPRARYAGYRSAAGR